MTNNKIKDEGVEKLAAVNFPLLSALYLGSNGIGDKGAQRTDLTSLHPPYNPEFELQLYRTGRGK